MRATVFRKKSGKSTNGRFLSERRLTFPSMCGIIGSYK